MKHRFKKSILHQPRELRSVRWTRKRQWPLYITSNDSLPTSACQLPIGLTFHRESLIKISWMYSRFLNFTLR